MLNNCLCIIPARGCSKRFPRKNIALLKGKPLVAYAIESAIKSNIFSSIKVSSEDEEILTIADKYGSDIPLLRPDYLAQDDIRVPQVCLQVIKDLEKKGNKYKYFGILLPSSPIRRIKDLQQGLRNLISRKEAHYIMSLVKINNPPQRSLIVKEGYIKPFLGKKYMRRTQDLDQLYRHDGTFIYADVKAFKKEQDYYGSKILPYLIDFHFSIDIDYPQDLFYAEFLLNKMLNENANA